MSGQWRTLRVTLTIGALAATLALSGCSSSRPSSLPCELPDGASLVELPDGGYGVDQANGDRWRLGFANGRCVISSYIGSQPRLERSDEQLRFLYDYYVLTLGPCLDVKGYPFMTPPTRQRFVESGGNWSPYDAVFSGYLDAEEIAMLGETCPHLPGPMLGAP